MNTWIKTNELVFEYTGAAKPMKMNLYKSSFDAKAELITPEGKFYIRRKGFWRTETIVNDADGRVLIHIKPQTWYGSRWQFDFEHKTWTVQIKNNPLAEWHLFLQNECVLTYALDPGAGNTALSIKNESGEIPPVLHGLLWYFFLPVARESGIHDALQALA